MVIQLSNGRHLYRYTIRVGFLKLRREYRWSIYKAVPVQIKGGIGVDFECEVEGLTDDAAMIHLIGNGFQPSDVELLVKALNDPQTIPYKAQPPWQKIERIRDEAKAKIRQAA